MHFDDIPQEEEAAAAAIEAEEAGRKAKVAAFKERNAAGAPTAIPAAYEGEDPAPADLTAERLALLEAQEEQEEEAAEREADSVVVEKPAYGVEADSVEAWEKILAEKKARKAATAKTRKVRVAEWVAEEVKKEAAAKRRAQLQARVIAAIAEEKNADAEWVQLSKAYEIAHMAETYEQASALDKQVHAEWARAAKGEQVAKFYEWASWARAADEYEQAHAQGKQAAEAYEPADEYEQALQARVKWKKAEEELKQADAQPDKAALAAALEEFEEEVKTAKAAKALAKAAADGGEDPA